MASNDTNLHRIREALRTNNVVLTRGELRIDKPESPAVEVLPPVRNLPWDGSPTRTTTEEPVTVRLKPTTWAAAPWYELPHYARRLEAEITAVRAQFPTAKLAFLPGDTLVWELPICTLGGTCYRIAVKYPSTFPLGEPSVFVLSPELKPSPHRFSDGSLCLGHAFCRETSALTTAAWASAWLSAYEVYLEDGAWPEFRPQRLVATWEK